MFCPKCGADAENSKFCPNCGAAVESQPFTQNNNYQYSNPKAKKVNKVAYGIIAILLGDLGIHRFYAGRILSGIIYLLFCWTAIPGILGLIEGIVALCRNDADPYGNIEVRDGFFI